MRTRRSPRNQERLWRALGEVKRHVKVKLHLVLSTVDGKQNLSCGYSVNLPACWTGRPPRSRRCFDCEAVEKRNRAKLEKTPEEIEDDMYDAADNKLSEIYDSGDEI